MTFIKFRCRACGTRYSVKQSKAGKTTDCKKCGSHMEVPYPPLELPEEVTTGGAVIHRHEPGQRDFEPAVGDEQNIQLITDHVEKHIGEINGVFHEVVSDLVHVDLHLIPPTAERPFQTLVTTGMSDRPMSPPDEVSDLAHAELMIALPPDWPLSHEAFEDENHYWPVRWLKMLARFPHEYDTWLFEGHSVPNGDPPEPFADNTKFCGWLLLSPLSVPDEFRMLEVNKNKTIHFFSILPLYEGEMELKLSKGTDALINGFDKAGVTEVVDVGRPDTSRKRFGWF